MKCIYCGHENTRVANSRKQSRTGGVWRRRLCGRCGQAHTSIETSQLPHIVSSEGAKLVFTKSKLVASIASSLANDNWETAEQLGDTVVKIALEDHGVPSVEDLSAICHGVLEKYDTSAAGRYAQRYALLK